MAGRVATPWGRAAVVDEVAVRQRAGDRSFSTHLQLLETDRGERLVRLAYATAEHGWARRGPVTLRVADLDRMRRALAGHAELERVLYPSGPMPEQPSARGRRRRASPG